MTNAVNIASLGPAMTADSSGNVGIGTSSPSLLLSVGSTTKRGLSTLIGNSTTVGSPRFTLDNSAATGGKNFGLYVGNTAAGSFNISNITDGLTVLDIDSFGRMTLPYQPRFLATIAGSTQTGIYTANGSYIQIRFNSATFNVGSCFNTGTYTFTAPVTGYYQFYISTYFYGWTVGSNEPYSLYFYKNGSVAARFAVGAQPSSGANPTTNSNQITLYLTAGDYVSAYVNVAAGSGTAILYYESTFFGGYLLG